MPMKRSRVFTRVAMISEKVENSAEPKITMATTRIRFAGFQLMVTPMATERA